MHLWIPQSLIEHLLRPGTVGLFYTYLVCALLRRVSLPLDVPLVVDRVGVEARGQVPFLGAESAVGTSKCFSIRASGPCTARGFSLSGWAPSPVQALLTTSLGCWIMSFLGWCRAR